MQLKWVSLYRDELFVQVPERWVQVPNDSFKMHDPATGIYMTVMVGMMQVSDAAVFNAMVDRFLKKYEEHYRLLTNVIRDGRYISRRYWNGAAEESHTFVQPLEGLKYFTFFFLCMILL